MIKLTESKVQTTQLPMTIITVPVTNAQELPLHKFSQQLNLLPCLLQKHKNSNPQVQQ